MKQSGIRNEIDASPIWDEFTAVTVKDGVVTEMTDGTFTYTRN